MLDYSNKEVVVTGGGSGIGRAASLAFARQKATVHLIDLQQEMADAVVREIGAAGGKAYAYACDVSVQAAVHQVFEKIGKVDVLLNNAGIAHIGKAHTTAEEDFDRLYAVNVKGVYNCMHAAIPGMQQQGGGVILNMGSIAAHSGLSDRFAYSMSKGAVNAMTLSVAKDYLNDHIRCNCISPARVHTPFVDGFLAEHYPGREKEMFDLLSEAQPIGRMGTPEEIADLILFLCADEASFITGCDYPIDGGYLTLKT
ncbi:MAG: glucose 1-dehydrogenase [Terrimonas sp.]|nr:glucose 1-dehydrogenase [Terrimonas sp.]